MDELVKWSKIEHQIDEARDLKTIIKLQEQIDIIKILVKQADGGLKVQNKCSRYRICLEQKAGDIYRQTPDDRGDKSHKDSGTDFPNLTDKQKIIKDTGKTKRTFHKWAKESDIPEEKVLEYEGQCNEKEEELTTAGLLKYVKINRKEEENKSDIQTDIIIKKGDFKEVLSDVYNIDAIITDPPYPKEYIQCWSDLSLYAKNHLKEDGFLVAYSGQYNLPEVINRLSEHLTYVWTFCLYHSGKCQLVNGVNIMCGWKPILIYSKGRKKMRFSAYDVTISESREKENHKWQQSKTGVKSLIETFSKPGELIVDPFAGSGTFLKVANELNRNSIGADLNDQT